MNKRIDIVIVIVTLFIPLQPVYASNDDLSAFWRGVICFAFLFGAMAIFKIIKAAIEDWKEEEKKKAKAIEERNQAKLEMYRRKREEERQIEKCRRLREEAEAQERKEIEEKERAIREEIRKSRILFGDEKNYGLAKSQSNQSIGYAIYLLHTILSEELLKKWGQEHDLPNMMCFFEDNIHFLGFENVTKYSANTLTATYQGRFCYIKMFPFYKDIENIERQYKDFLQMIREQKADGFYIVTHKNHSTLKSLSENDCDIHFIDTSDIHKILKSIGEKDNLQDKEDKAISPTNTEQYPLYLFEKNGYSWEIVRWNFYIMKEKGHTPQSLYDYLSKQSRIKGSYALPRFSTNDSCTIYTPVSGRFNYMLEHISFIIKADTLRNSFIEHKLFHHWYLNWCDGRPFYNHLSIYN